MTLILLFVITFVIFIALEVVGLGRIVKPVFERQIGDLLLENFRVFPAFVFYAFYVVVMIWFVSAPALAQGHSTLWVLGNAALFAAAAYGTYEFASLAVMKNWTWTMVVTDMSWGTFVSAVAAVGGIWLTRILAAGF